jgi:uncharacterized membrane protein
MALAIVLAALANILGYFSVPLGPTNIHFMQLPIIIAGLALGPVMGGMVGFSGATLSALTLPSPNPFILPGNALLGFLTGLFYSRARALKPPIVPQLLALFGAIGIQFPYIYISDVYLVSLPSPFVLSFILPKLLLEDVISLLIAHVILFRVDVAGIIAR